MNLLEANSWSNFSYGYRNDTPSGWLLNHERTRLILFEKNKNSANDNIKILVHTFYVNHLGEPAGIKSSRQMGLDDAWDKWHDLQLKDWTFEEYELPETR